MMSIVLHNGTTDVDTTDGDALCMNTLLHKTG